MQLRETEVGRYTELTQALHLVSGLDRILRVIFLIKQSPSVCNQGGLVQGSMNGLFFLIYNQKSTNLCTACPQQTYSYFSRVEVGHLLTPHLVQTKLEKRIFGGKASDKKNRVGNIGGGSFGITCHRKLCITVKLTKTSTVLVPLPMCRGFFSHQVIPV